MQTKIPVRTLGKIPMNLSIMGLGTVKFGRNTDIKYPEKFDLPTDEQINDLLSTCKNYGINFLDTAPAYGLAEERLGNLISHERSDWIICTKVGEQYIEGSSTYNFTESYIQRSIENSLAKLKTDYLDIVLLHSNGCIFDIIENSISALQKLKQQKIVRAIGVSTKNCSETSRCLPLCDTLMVTYNLRQVEELQNIIAAKKHNTSIIVKKFFDSGHLITQNGNVHESLRQVLSFESVVSVVVGTISPQHLRQNIAMLSSIAHQ
jgi:aryl-alcohol dehydrogenase-like predicted oxidoreductase